MAERSADRWLRLRVHVDDMATASSDADRRDRPLLRVLTVGDGDLSYSLALHRAFSAQIVLTATTLPDADEVCATYARAAEILAELQARGVTVLHGVDATQLDVDRLGTFDHVCFLHPHLGLSDLLDEAAHAHRHSVLMAHFLHSAAQLLTAHGHINLTLCGSQPKTCAQAA